MSYQLARQFLFRLPAEASHNISLKMLKMADNAGMLGMFMPQMYSRPVELMGITFPNAVGLAAGLDKNGDYIDGLSKLGFGFIEVGTVTPKPQDGNPLPRLFRLEERNAIINRMGFNNYGVDYMAERLRKKKYDGVIGVNVGKNKDTPAEEAASDYITCINKVYPYASYITINISSPNTPGLRALQFGDSLRSMLQDIKDCQERLNQQHGRYVPFVVKIAPDMSDDEVHMVARTLLDYNMDGAIATNTTLSREGVESLAHGKEQGGLSGAPLTKRSTHVVKELCAALEGRIPVIASGGVMSAQDAVEKVRAGAKLVQVYSGLIYRGPVLVREAAEAIGGLEG
ncbi:quinone-dependent dihydroorotate dehydrogenase [Hahella sp. HN01]|uniref:quinone-dependent dihydroorotate dehydrogenase n=1 Tax=unclassified Hahella TaxID=2624107 RepID=UPI001C1ED895|nr:quinone-dependent dihydroorotate dehydrogenase [Hahella sp. HN01]MBU6952406.1 quinone-dependent dihydroorotate dehydrogenase [Hahella sp. HN01]